MTQAQKLEALIEKARDNGWKYDYNLYLEEHNTAAYISGMILDPCCAEDAVNLKDLIFNHDFAKALFGIEPYRIFWYMGTEKEYNPDAKIINCFNVDNTQFHLQGAAISDDPISYMYDAVFGKLTP